MEHISLTKEELFQAIGRAIELGKYQLAHDLLNDMIRGYEEYQARLDGHKDAN